VPAGITADLAGNPRFADVPSVADTGSGTAPIVDMGAYESPNPNLVVAGTDGPDQFLLSLFPDQASIQIVAPGKSSTYSVLAITAITVNGGEGDDRLTVDFTNGSPVPSGGVTFDGQGGSDCVRVVTPGNNATLTGEHVSVGTAAPIGFSNTEGTSFDLGTGRLTKNGSGTAVLVASSSYAGGTEVLGGALVVGHANALPVGGSLTIGPGAAVVLPSGVIQAAVGIPGNAAFPAPAGCGEWQVDCLLSTVYCLPSTVHSLPSTVHGPRSTVHMPPRFWADTSLAVACDTLIPSPATRASPASDHRSESGTGHGMVQSAEVQGCQQLAGWAVSGTSVKKKAPPPKAVDQVLAALWPPKRVGDHEANRGRRANHAADRPAGRR
jgi:autotransporter-associated beta strand protein